MKYLLLFLFQTHLVLARKRGVRNTRRMKSTRFLARLEAEDGNIFGRMHSEAPEGESGDMLFLELKRQSKGKGGKGDKAGLPVLDLESQSKGKGSKAKGKNGIHMTKSQRSSRRSKASYYYPISTESPDEMTDETLSLTTMPSEALLSVPPRRSNLCTLDAQGAFGADRGDENIIEYLYLVEVEPGTTTSQFQNMILPRLERTTVDLIIPVIFRPLCGNSRMIRLESSLQEMSIYLGVSANPPDRIIYNADCGALFVSPCFVVRGAITVYSEGKSNGHVQAEMSLLLADVFEMGSLSTIVAGVDGVAFRALAPEVMTSSPTEAPEILRPTPALPPTPIGQSPFTTDPESMPVAVTPSPTPLPLPASFLPVATQVPTIIPTVDFSESEEKEEEGNLLDWWRTMLVVVIVLVMLVAIYVVYRCPGKSKKQSLSIDDDDDDPSRL